MVLVLSFIVPPFLRSESVGKTTNGFALVTEYMDGTNFKNSPQSLRAALEKEEVSRDENDPKYKQ